MTDLFPYQQTAIDHLKEWKVGALFMEAGTGKTRVACELINCVEDIDLLLWVGPLQTIRRNDGSSVKDEIKKWGGFSCDNVIFVGIESIQSSDRIFIEILDAVKIAKAAFVVIDESLKIKNLAAKRTERMLEIGRFAKYKLILNGTPISKNVMDIYPQMLFLSPKILNMTPSQYKNTFCDYTIVTKKFKCGRSYSKEFITGYENIDYLYSLIRNYIYEVDLNLNVTQNYKSLYYNISDEERIIYNEIKDIYLSDEMLLFKNDNIFIEMTQKMQHSYCLVPSKFSVIDSLFQEIDQRDSIIFCKYIDSSEECKKRYPEALVLSYQKESLGLNLQNYRNTIYFDKIWDLALRVQSGRRTFRTGQLHDCKYYDLTGNIGLDRLIDSNIDKKVSQSEYFKKVSKQQLEQIL